MTLIKSLAYIAMLAMLLYSSVFAESTSVQVSASADDGSIRFGGTDATDLVVSGSGNIMWVGRSGAGDGMGTMTIFRDVPIPQGFIIDTAYILYNSNNAYSSSTVNSEIWVEDVDSALVLVDGSAGYTDWIGRTWSATVVVWNNIPAWSADELVRSPEIKTLIQVPISRPGWKSGNAIHITLHDSLTATTSSSTFREVKQWDQATGKAPILIVFYTEAVAGAGQIMMISED